MTEISCSLQIGDELPWPSVLPLFADSGCVKVNLPATGERGTFRLSEPDEAKALARELREHGLGVDWVHGPYHWPRLYDDRRGKRSMALAAHVHWLRASAEVGSRAYILHPFFGRDFPDPDPPDALGHLTHSFDVLVREGQRLGVLVAVENLQHDRCNAYAEGLLEALPDLGFCFDLGHSALAHDRGRWLPRFADRLVALHLHDNRGVQDDHLFPGDGLADWPEWITFLRQCGYNAVWGMEVHAPEDGGDPQAVKKRLAERTARLGNWIER